MTQNSNFTPAGCAAVKPIGKQLVQATRRGIAAFFAALVLCMATAAHAADDSSKHFEIKPKPLADALMEFGVQSELTVVAPSTLTVGKKAAAVRGDLAPTDALGRLLKGSGLTFARAADGTIDIQAVQSSGPVQVGAAESGLEDLTSVPASLEEVIVTAEKLTKDVQRTPIAIAVLNGSDLQAQGINTLNEALRTVAGVQIQGGASGYSQLYIRGVGPQTINPGGATTTESIDDILLTDQIAYVQFDVRQIEVLKGPQGTLQGAGATGGSVLVSTADPADTLGGQATFQGGNYDALRVEGAVNVPLTSNLLSRFAYVHSQRSGYYSDGGGDEDIDAARAKFLYTPIDSVSISVAGEYDHWGGIGESSALAPIESHPNDPYLAPPFTSVGRRDWKKFSAWGRVDWDLGWGVATFEPGWYNFFQHGDSGLLGGASLTRAVQSTEELRLGSPASSTVKWVVGLFNLNHKFWGEPFADFLTPEASGYKNALDACVAGGILIDHANMPCSSRTITYDYTDSKAAFGQVTYPLVDDLRVIAGLRYSDTATSTEIRNAASGAVTSPYATTRAVALTWKAGVEYDVAPKSMLYATISTASAPGGVNTQAGGTEIPGVGVVPLLIATERVTAYELGAKNRFINDRLQVNGSAYYYKDKNLQSGVVGPVTPTSAPAPTIYSVNGDATVYGLESQVDWLLTRLDRINASVLYSRSTWDSLVYPTAFYGTGAASPGPGDCTGQPYGPGTNCYGPGVIDRSGVPLVLAPTWTETLGYEHTFLLRSGASVVFNGMVRWVSSSSTSVEPIRTPGQLVPETIQQPYHKTDLRLTYTPAGEAWALTAFVDNLENVAVKQFLQGYPPTQFNTQLSPPRTLGANISIKF